MIMTVNIGKKHLAGCGRTLYFTLHLQEALVEKNTYTIIIYMLQILIRL
jgi:hypothetical protein